MNEAMAKNRMDLMGIAKTLKIKEFVNDWLTQKKGKVGDSFMPFADFYQHVYDITDGPWGVRLMEPADAQNFVMALYQEYVWSFTKTTIIIEEEVRSALINGKMNSAFPAEVFKRLPYWSVYIPVFDYSMCPDEHPTDKIAAIGMVVTRVDVDGDDTIVIDLNLVLKDKEDIQNQMYFLDLRGKTIVEALELKRVYNVRHRDTPETEEETMETLPGILEWFLPIVAYVCSQQVPIVNAAGECEWVTHNPEPKKKGKGWVLRQTGKPKTLVYGQELREALERHNAALRESGDRKPHVRAAHWHGYWTGPRNGKRNYIHHWIPPVIVSGTVKEEE
jgi:hypothetical protein